VGRQPAIGAGGGLARRAHVVDMQWGAGFQVAQAA
jgi:hypothetical protein